MLPEFLVALAGGAFVGAFAIDAAVLPIHAVLVAMVEDLAETIEEMFGVPNCENTRVRIRKIREMAYNDKKSGNIERLREKRV